MLIDLKQLFANPGKSEPVMGLLVPEPSEIDGRRLDGPVAIRGELRNSAGVVSLTYEASVQVETLCDRCLVPVCRKMSFPFHHYLVRKDNADQVEEEETLLVENDTLHMLQVALDDLWLAMPSQFLCAEDCNGLCSGCGADLNQEPCRCAKEIDPRLAALKELL